MLALATGTHNTCVSNCAACSGTSGANLFCCVQRADPCSRLSDGTCLCDNTEQARAVTAGQVITALGWASFVTLGALAILYWKYNLPRSTRRRVMPEPPPAAAEELDAQSVRALRRTFTNALLDVEVQRGPAAVEEDAPEMQQMPSAVPATTSTEASSEPRAASARGSPEREEQLSQPTADQNQDEQNAEAQRSSAITAESTAQPPVRISNTGALPAIERPPLLHLEKDEANAVAVAVPVDIVPPRQAEIASQWPPRPAHSPSALPPLRVRLPLAKPDSPGIHEM